jgi:hypothetical protein
MYLGKNVLIKGFVSDIMPTNNGRTIVSITFPDKNGNTRINIGGRSLAAIEGEFEYEGPDVAKDVPKRSSMIKLTSSSNNDIFYVKADSIIGVGRGGKNQQDVTEVSCGPESYYRVTETVEEVIALIDAAKWSLRGRGEECIALGLGMRSTK